MQTATNLARKFVTNWLRVNARSYLLTCAASGTEALTRVEKKAFGLYLFDDCLSDMTAPELCERVRAIDAKPPVITFSPFDREIDLEWRWQLKLLISLLSPRVLDGSQI